jgi:uncharacterized repeat protein (TIGR01451 family)
MKTKIFAVFIIIIFGIYNGLCITSKSANVDESQPSWPTLWIPVDADPAEISGSNIYRDIKFTYYFFNNYYFFARFECYGTPDFNNTDSRYKLFIDTDNPHNMGISGSKVYESEFLLFIEDSSKLGADGIGDIYLLEDLDNNGFISDDWPDYVNTPGRITDTSIADYRIVGNCLDLYVRLNEINNIINSYITWATDQADPNLDAAPNIDRSDCFWNMELLKADMSIMITDDGYSVYPGDSFTYSLNITNYGPSEAHNINIIDNLPSEISYNFSDPAPNSISSNSYLWVIPSLDPGCSMIINLGVNVNDDANGSIFNTAQVISDLYDPMPGNNQFTIQTEITTIGSGEGDPDDNSTGDNGPGDSDTGDNSTGDNGDGDSGSGDNSTDDSGSSDSGSFGGYPDGETSTGEEADIPPIENLSSGENNYTIDIYNTTDGVNQLNYPPTNPDVYGPTEGFINIEYNFSIASTDIDNNEIRYIVDWDDGTSSESGFLITGESFNITHKWTQPGDYKINVSADDDNTNSTSELTIKINKPTQLKTLDSSNNIWLIPILLLALLLLLLLALLEKRRKDKQGKKK